MRRNRGETARALQATEFDLVVVGGGITGAGIARDAALRGLKVALVEKGDLARGTSSASSKLIHGGLRYLEQLELALVREGVRERSVLMKLAPHLARPLPFLFPIYKNSRAGPFTVEVGMWLYDALALFGNYRRHRMLGAREVGRTEPMLGRAGLRAGTLYYDCMTDDARLVVETTIDALEHGAVIATHFEVASLRKGADGRISGVMVRDRLSPADLGDDLERAPRAGPTLDVRAKLVVVAAGPWTDELLGPLRGGKPLLRPTKGVHIVLDKARLPINHAVVLTSVRDGRVLFAIPWRERTVIGTTDTDDHDPESCIATAADVAYLLETANHYFPDLHARESDVISTWAGLRPLIAAGAVSESKVSREHEVLDIAPGLIAIAGGKLTTYRLMAEQVVDRAVAKLGRVLERCRTETTPLPGAADARAISDVEALAKRIARESRLELDVARHLVHSYGLRAREVLALAREPGLPEGRLVPDLPFVWAEVVWGARRELAERLDDVLRRRMLVFLKDRDQGLSIAPRVADVLARELAWDDERKALELSRYEKLVAASRSFRAPAPRPPGVPARVV
jgi:glycerol-3-phosphate dehydrogenase